MIKTTSSGGTVVNEVKGSTEEILADLTAIIVSVMHGISGDSPATQALHEKGSGHGVSGSVRRRLGHGQVRPNLEGETRC